jgi:hypothetical protein
MPLVAHRVQGSAARGGKQRPTIAAVVEAGGVGEYGAGDELPGEDGSGGGEVAEVGEEHHHLHSTERAQGERWMCSDRKQTRETSAESDEGRGTHRATGGHQRGEHGGGGGGGLHSPPSRRGSAVGGRLQCQSVRVVRVDCGRYQNGESGWQGFGLDSAQIKLGLCNT